MQLAKEHALKPRVRLKKPYILALTSNDGPSNKKHRMAMLRRFRPLLDRVLVEKSAPEVKTKSGLFIPEKAQEKVNIATVVAVGPGRVTEDGETRPVTVKVGEQVLVPEYGGTKVNFEDTDYLLFRDGDILGVIDS